MPLSGPTFLATTIASGNVANDAVDSGNPIKIGGKATVGATTPVQTGDRVDTWHDEWGRPVFSDYDIELGQNIGSTILRDRLMAQRYTVLSDSVADGLASFWTQTVANGGSITVTGGAGVLATSAAAAGSAQLGSTVLRYFPGQMAWLNSAVQMRDPSLTGNVQRIGAATESAGVPQDGFYYELLDNVLYAVTVKAGTPTKVASTSWTRATVAPFTPTANFTQYEIRYTANTVWFYINNVLRHVQSSPTTPLTTTLNFKILLQNINTGNTNNLALSVRNIGLGRFGDPAQFAAPNGAQGFVPVGTGTYSGQAGTGSATVNVPTAAHVRSFCITAGTSNATALIPGISGTVTIPGSNQSSQSLNENLEYNQMVGPQTFSITNAASYVITWIVPT